MLALCVQLFLPIAVLGCCMRESSTLRRLVPCLLCLLPAHEECSVKAAPLPDDSQHMPVHALASPCPPSVLPLQISEAFEDGDTTFSRLTMANIDPASK